MRLFQARLIKGMGSAAARYVIRKGHCERHDQGRVTHQQLLPTPFSELVLSLLFIFHHHGALSTQTRRHRLGRGVKEGEG